MNNFAQYKVAITNHAYKRYLERVGNIGRDELQIWCSSQIQEWNYWAKTKDQCIQMDDVWFGYEIEEGILYLATCLGRSHIDLPKAMSWAYRNNDRIALDTNQDMKVSV